MASGRVHTMSDLCRALGIRARGANFATIRRVAAEAEIELPTRRRSSSAGRRLPADVEVHLPIVVGLARSHKQVLEAFGMRAGVEIRLLKNSIAALGIDAPHLPASGQPTRRPPSARERQAFVVRLNDGTTKTRPRVERLIRFGLKTASCEGCHRTTWQGRPIPLEVDHIDGDNQRHHVDNLRLLCPNCHAFTPTYRGRNQGRRQ